MRYQTVASYIGVCDSVIVGTIYSVYSSITIDYSNYSTGCEIHIRADPSKEYFSNYLLKNCKVLHFEIHTQVRAILQFF